MLRFAWLLAALPVWLGARTVAYTLVPASPVARELEGRTGGSAPVAVTAAVLVAVLAVGAAVLWVASLSVRERAALAVEEAPPLDWQRLALRVAGIFVFAALTFTGVEVWLHVQAGLGFHGWHCLVGPVHRDALPFLGAFSIAAGLVLAAVEQLVAWARRLVRALRAREPRLRPAALPRPLGDLLLSFVLPRRYAVRGPPLLV
jgi:hypothetical protein